MKCYLAYGHCFVGAPKPARVSKISCALMFRKYNQKAKRPQAILRPFACLALCSCGRRVQEGGIPEASLWVQLQA